MTLYTALVSTAKVAAPMAPFMSEEIYRNLVCSVDKSAPESVHLCLYPPMRGPGWTSSWRRIWMRCCALSPRDVPPGTCPA